MNSLRLQDSWKSFRQSKLFGNTVALYASYIAQYLVPLITVPYTLRVLTPAGYGRGAFALSLASLFGVFSGYGFNLTATRAVSARSHDTSAVSRIASEVICAEALLLGISCVAYAVIVGTVPRLRSDASVMWIAFFAPTFANLNPTWLYQGLEKLKFSAKVSVIVRLAYVPALFFLVRKPSDTSRWLLLQAAMPAAAGLYLWLHAKHRLGITWMRPKPEAVRFRLREGFAVFVSQSAVSMYTTANTFFVGILTTTTFAGYYSAAEKFVRIAMTAWQPLQQAVFPRASHLASESQEAALRLTRKTLLFQGGMGACITAGLYALAPWFVPLVLGLGYLPSITILRILSPLPLLVAVSNVLGIQIMVPFKRDKPYMASLLAAGLLNIALAIVLVPRWRGDGMAFAATCSELLITVGMLWYLRRVRLMPSLRLRPGTIHG